MRDSRSEKVAAKANVLNGPPGLLFGLTLFVFVAAGLYFGWTSEAVSASEKPTPATNAMLVQQALEREDARVFEQSWPEP
jgi:hypothetical protein